MQVSGVPERWRDPLRVGLVAAAIRLLWVGVMSRQPQGLSDPAIYRAAADQIAAGDGYRTITGTVTSYYPPGYPFFLGALEWLVNLVGLDSHFVMVVGFIQALLGSLSAALVVVIARRLVAGPSSKRVALTAGLMVAVWPNLVVHSSVLLSETLFIAVFTLAFALLVKSILGDANSRAYLVASAGLLGVSTLIRPQSALLLIPAVAVAATVARVGLRQVVTHVAALVVGVVIVVTPWSIRNAVALDGFVIVSTNTGDNLCIGFNPGAQGGFGMEPECQTASSYTDGPDQERRRNSELRGRATSWALANPSALPGLALSKLRITFGGDHDGVRAAESYGEDEHLGDATRTFLDGLADTYFFAVLALSIAGMGVILLADWRSRFRGTPVAVRLSLILVVLFGTLIPVVSFGDQRFKVPITPFLAMLAAVAATRAFEHFRRPGTERPGWSRGSHG